MIPNLWSRIVLVCGNHEYEKDEKPLKMAPHEKAKGSVAGSLYGSSLEMFYSCPKYYPQNRKEGEPLCRNHISIEEYKKAVKRISDEMEAAMEDGGDINLKGFRFTTKGGVEYRVLKHTEKEIVVSCLNKRALRF